MLIPNVERRSERLPFFYFSLNNDCSWCTKKRILVVSFFIISAHLCVFVAGDGDGAICCKVFRAINPVFCWKAIGAGAIPLISTPWTADGFVSIRVRKATPFAKFFSKLLLEAFLLWFSDSLFVVKARLARKPQKLITVDSRYKATPRDRAKCGLISGFFLNFA